MARKSVPPPQESPVPAPASLRQRAGEFVTRRAAALAVLLTLAGTARIALTYETFHHTSDEPAHIACGMEWLERGQYTFETQHPPLSRIFAGLGAKLAGAHLDRVDKPGKSEAMWWHGATILFSDEHYERRLATIRAAMLPFFWLACWGVFLWGRYLWGPAAGVAAVFLLSMMPLVLAHAGLATTDMALTGTFVLAAFTLVRLLEAPEARRGVWCGLALGFMLVAKFSGIPYFGLSVALGCAWWLIRHRGPGGAVTGARLQWLGAAAAVAFLVVWSVYRFSFAGYPFPEWFDGIRAVAEHNREGDMSYFLGKTSSTGDVRFFPVLTVLKTPVAVLALFALALVYRRKGAWLAWCVVAGVFAVAMPARINIGLRHILPVFPFIAILGAGAAVSLWERAATAKWAGPVLALLLVWTAGASLAAHPDYLADFNFLAGAHPEDYTVDSDLDWGQDILRLRNRIRELGAPTLAFTAPIYTSYSRLGFPPVTPNDPNQPTPGWNAVSMVHLKLYRFSAGAEAHRVKLWPELMPPSEMVGKSILLYYYNPQPGQR
jgi:hypothetical protein